MQLGRVWGGGLTLPAGLWEEGSVLSCRQWVGRGSLWGPNFLLDGYCHLGRQELGLNSGNGTLEGAVRKPESELLTDVGVRGTLKEDSDIKTKS